MGGLSIVNFSATVKGSNFYHTEEVYSLVEAATISGQIEYSSDIMTERQIQEEYQLAYPYIKG